MRTATSLRRALIGANLLLCGALCWAALGIARGQPLPAVPEDFDPLAFALDDGAAPGRENQGLIAGQLDRALEVLPPLQEPPQVTAPGLTPPPALDLVALVPHPDDPSRNLAIVRWPDGVQRLLRIGDEVRQGTELWSVVTLRLEPMQSGEGLELGRLTLQTPSRVHVYEAVLRSA